MEGNLRLAVKKLHSVQTSGKTWLTNALTDVDSFGVGVLSRDQFTQALSQLTGIQISKKQARALCVVADANGKGDTVEIGKFVARITCGASRADNCVKKIPTLRGYPVKDDEFIGGKIAYPKSRSLVRAPTNFDVNAVDASMFPPDANLVLRHVFGYDGGSKCTSQNLFVTGDQTVVVFVAAAVGVVHDTVSKKQRHFLGHTGTITCLTMCDSSVTYKGVTYPPRTLCATGQTIARNQGQGGDTSWEGKENASGNTQSQCPFVAVWDVRTLQEITRVPLARDTQSVAAVAFSTDGNLLTTVGNDAHHTVQVWDWRVDDVDRVSNVGSVKKTKLGDLEKPILKKKPKGVHENGSPGSVFGLRFDPNTATKVTRFVTWGKKHVKVWTRYSENGPWVSRQMRFGKFGVMDVAFLPPVVAENKDVPGDGCDKKVTHKNCFSSIVTGHDDGSLLVWVSGVAVRQVNDAHVGGRGGSNWDGRVSIGGGVSALHVTRDENDHEKCTLTSGGSDGFVKRWSVVRHMIRGDTDGVPHEFHTIGDAITDPVALAEAESAGTSQSGGFKLRNTNSAQAVSFKKTFPQNTNAIASLDSALDSGVVFAGTRNCEVWQVRGLGSERETTAVVTMGHAGAVTCACWHPTDPDKAFTACEGGVVLCFDASTTCVVKKTGLPFPITAIAVGGRGFHLGNEANDGQTQMGGGGGDATQTQTRQMHVAIGGSRGELVVLHEHNFSTLWNTTHSQKSQVEDVKFSPDGGTRLVTTHKDGSVCVFQRKRLNGETVYAAAHKFFGHGGSSAKHVDWSSCGKMLATCGGDRETLFWDVVAAGDQTRVGDASKKGDQVGGTSTKGDQAGDQSKKVKSLPTKKYGPNKSCHRDTRFATWTRPLGFPVMGIWGCDKSGQVNVRYGLARFPNPLCISQILPKRPFADCPPVITQYTRPHKTDTFRGHDRSSIDVSPCGRFCVTGDDVGNVTLRPYPALARNAGLKQYRGHAGRVTNVRFNKDGARLLSVGGTDRCAFLFDVVQEDVPEPVSVATPEKQWGALDDTGKRFGFRVPTEVGGFEGVRAEVSEEFVEKTDLCVEQSEEYVDKSGPYEEQSGEYAQQSEEYAHTSGENVFSEEPSSADDDIAEEDSDSIVPEDPFANETVFVPPVGLFQSLGNASSEKETVVHGGVSTRHREISIGRSIDDLGGGVVSVRDDRNDDPPFVASPKVPIDDSESEPEIDEDLGESVGYSSEEVL